MSIAHLLDSGFGRSQTGPGWCTALRQTIPAPSSPPPSPTARLSKIKLSSTRIQNAQTSHRMLLWCNCDENGVLSNTSSKATTDLEQFPQSVWYAWTDKFQLILRVLPKKYAPRLTPMQSPGKWTPIAATSVENNTPLLLLNYFDCALWQKTEGFSHERSSFFSLRFTAYPVLKLSIALSFSVAEQLPDTFWTGTSIPASASFSVNHSPDPGLN